MTKTTKTTETATVETYWDAILGHSETPRRVIRDHGLAAKTRDEIEAWLRDSEDLARAQGFDLDVPDSVRATVLVALAG